MITRTVGSSGYPLAVNHGPINPVHPAVTKINGKTVYPLNGTKDPIFKAFTEGMMGGPAGTISRAGVKPIESVVVDKFLNSPYGQSLQRRGADIVFGGLENLDILGEQFGNKATELTGLPAFKNLSKNLLNKILIKGYVPTLTDTRSALNTTIRGGRQRMVAAMGGKDVAEAFGIDVARHFPIVDDKDIKAIHGAWQGDWGGATARARVLGTGAARDISEGINPLHTNFRNIGRQFDHYKSPTDAGKFLSEVYANSGGKVSDAEKRMAQLLWDNTHHWKNMSSIPEPINLGIGGIAKPLLQNTEEITSRLGSDVGGLMSSGSNFVEKRIPVHEAHWQEPALDIYNNWHTSKDVLEQQKQRLLLKLSGLFG